MRKSFSYGSVVDRHGAWAHPGLAVVSPVPLARVAPGSARWKVAAPVASLPPRQSEMISKAARIPLNGAVFQFDALAVLSQVQLLAVGLLATSCSVGNGTPKLSVRTEPKRGPVILIAPDSDRLISIAPPPRNVVGNRIL